MSKRSLTLVIIFLVIVIISLIFLFFATADCVVNRAEVGMEVDWHQIEDCAY